VPRLALIGVGLMGASFALAARRAGAFDRVVGLDVDPSALDGACSAGIIDSSAASLEAAVEGADAVLVAVPPSEIPACVAAVCAALGPSSAPVFDVGSVKAPVMTALRTHPGGLPARFVPCHPMAGAEGQGYGAADATLYRQRRVFLTPGRETDPAALAAVDRLWRMCGAATRIIDADAHDRAVAATSHLPHLLAFAYMARFAADGHALFDFAGPGFRDFTRIAGGDPGLWRDILLSNRTAVVAELGDLVRRLEALGEAISDGREATLEAVFVAGRDARRDYASGRIEDGVGGRHGVA
jgi:prephenate dehydrogenase